MPLKPNLQWVVAGLLLGIFLSAIDNTIVATALGSILADLGGVDKYVWITSAYAVAVLAGMPIFGKLSDMFGRKRFFIFGLTVFLIGSALCGLAQSIVQLAIFRAIQGIGGGALLPIAFTIIFDLFPVEKRGKMTGLFGGVFGASSVIGPLLGAWITDAFSWHWVFYVNIPLGLVALFLVGRFYEESPQHGRQVIDWLGAFTLVASVVSLMFALELGGKEFAWASWQSLALFGSFAAFFLLFLFAERRAKEPILSFWMFRDRLFASSQVLAFLYGAVFVVPTIFIPLFVQSVYGGSATNAGVILMPMLIGSVVGSACSGFGMSKFRYRTLMTVSVVLFATGMALLSTIGPDTPRVLLSVYMVLAGLGVGFSFSLLPSASIHGMDFAHRGSANSTNSFFRSLGLALGITIYGSLQTKLLSSGLDERLTALGGGQSAFSSGDVRTAFSPEMRAKIPPRVLDAIVEAMSSSIATTFFWTLLPVAGAVVAVAWMGRAKLLDQQAK